MTNPHTPPDGDPAGRVPHVPTDPGLQQPDSEHAAAGEAASLPPFTPGAEVRLAVGWYASHLADADAATEGLPADQADMLRSLQDPGLTVAEIADRMELTENEVIRRSNALADTLRGMLPEGVPGYTPRHLREYVRTRQAELKAKYFTDWWGYTHEALAAATGMSEPHFQRFVSGRDVTPSLDKAAALLAKLETPPGQAEALIAQYYVFEREPYERQSAARRATQGIAPAAREGLGPAIALLRRERGITRAQLAQALGNMMLPTLDAKLRGSGPINDYEARAMLNALGLRGEAADAFIAQHTPEGQQPLIDPKTITHTVGQTVGPLLNSTGMSQRALAEAAGVSLSVIEKMMRGTTFPDPDVIERILRAAGASEEAVEVELAKYVERFDTRKAALMRQRGQRRK